VRCTMASEIRVPAPSPIGPKICEGLEALLKHRRGPTLGYEGGSKPSEFL
jgi:hypothetical protein